MPSITQFSIQGQVRRLRHLAQRVLPVYGLAETHLRLVNHGFNTTFRVETDPGKHTARSERFLLRVHRQEHHDPRLDPQQLVASELTWLAALHTETTLYVPEPLRTTSGAFVTIGHTPAAGSCVCSLLRWVDGRMHARHPTPAHLYKVGMLMAQLHRHAAQ